MRVKILDTTLRDGEQAPGFSMDLIEKIEVAKQLERLRVDIIEAGFAVVSPGDMAAVKAIASEIRGCGVASLARAVEKDIDAAWEGLRSASAPRIHVFIATSQIHMRYKLHMTEDEVLERTAAMVKYAKSYCDDIQFSAEDAARSDKNFLCRVMDAAIKSGATTINIPDTVGYTTPTEMYALVKYVRENVENADKVCISVHCHNDLGLATANSLGGIAAGATQVDCTVGGMGERAGNTSLEEVVMALHTRKAYYNAETNVDTAQIYRTCRLLQTVTGVPIPPNKAIVGQNAFSHESGIHQHGVMENPETYEIMTPASIGVPQNKMVLGKHSGRHAFVDRMRYLGIDLTKEQLDTAFEKFKDLADKKKVISDRDLEALLGTSVKSFGGRYILDSFVINSGNTIEATALVKLKMSDITLSAVSRGDGPIDAAFKAINSMLGDEFSLENFSLNSVTEGGDALGEALVRISRAGVEVVGRGLSTDVVEASIKAYINGVNKLVTA